MLEIIFWILFIILFYTYLGYALIIFILYNLKKNLSSIKLEQYDYSFEPEVCLFVTAYNESEYVRQKVENSLGLDYPKEKIQYLWITDGSDDGTQDLLKEFPNQEVHHLKERRGKMHAMNRGIQFVKTPIIIFSDTNTILNKSVIREIVARFSDPKVGCVAGEKRIVEKKSDMAAAAGEGLYWKFESKLKKMDAGLNSAVGAVGELFAIKRELFEEVETDTILDDFIISLRIAQKGYKIEYAPNAYAEEKASLNVKEELKRKIRIAAGGVQTIFRLRSLLNPFKYGLLSWQYVSHKVLRWTIAPFSFFLLLIVNFAIVLNNNDLQQIEFYNLFFYFQLIAYFFAFLGGYFENKKFRFKLFFAPFYFVVINYAAVLGVVRFFRGKQSVKWEKSKRA